MELARNAPAAFALLVAFAIFAKVLLSMAARHREELRSAAKDCHAVQKRGTDALIRQAASAAKQIEVQRATTDALRDMTTVVSRCEGHGG